MKLSKFSMGIGDRFAQQGTAQLSAFIKAKSFGVDVTPVWNKSNREHNIVHSEPSSVRAEADAAVKLLNWNGSYFVDADHIGVKTVDRFVDASDFFTLDVADFIGKPAADAEVAAFVDAMGKYTGTLRIPNISHALDVTADQIGSIAGKYLYAAEEAGRIYRHIEAAKGTGKFIAEVSMDETDQPQTPVQLLFILAALSREGVPAQTIAPKFTGRFNKGVDYVGDLAQFEKEFSDDLAVIAFAIKEFGMPADLKLSVHSGSDKFSIYPAIKRSIAKHSAGLHIKTAGTTWLAELIGLAQSGGEGLAIAKEVYAEALKKYDDLCAPYATVIDINKSRLPSAAEVSEWTGSQYADALYHDPKSPKYNANFRQLLHVGFKVAAQMGERYLNALRTNEAIVAKVVMDNLFDLHIEPLFL